MQAQQRSPVAGYIEYVLVLHPDMPEPELVQEVMTTFRLGASSLEVVRKTVSAAYAARVTE